MGQTTWLRQVLQEQSEELNSRLSRLEQTVIEDIYPFVQLRDFTDHGAKHAKAVEYNISRILPQSGGTGLTPFEIFAVIAACLLHDTGMSCRSTPYESEEAVRLNHARRSRALIRKNRDRLGLMEHEATIIGEICNAHGMHDLQYLQGELPSLHQYGRVRVAFLAALLRLADILDLTCERAPSIITRVRAFADTTYLYWLLHSRVSDVYIEANPSWSIVISAMPHKAREECLLCAIVGQINTEIKMVSPVLRAHGVFFREAELNLSRLASNKKHRIFKNPFLALSPFTADEARRFAGREKEIQQIVERLVGRKMVVLTGESGVGKTSLVQAGVMPRLAECKIDVVSFSFLGNPLTNLLGQLHSLDERTRRTRKGRNSDADAPDSSDSELATVIKRIVGASEKGHKIVVVGDHLEQMFTVRPAEGVKDAFIKQFAGVLGLLSPQTVSFLFCIREDYLPQLYDLSQIVPELCEREHIFHLHRLSKENAKLAMMRASEYARSKISGSLIDRIVEDLCEEGEGLIYPPFFQIVGHRLYCEVNRRAASLDEVSEMLYESLAGKDGGNVATAIVNNYFDSLLDGYLGYEKPIVAEILGTMVTDYYTKTRVTLAYLQARMPHCHDLERLLRKLIDQRIVRRSLNEYELIHDCLAKRVIEIVRKKDFLSGPVREAIKHIEAHYAEPDISSRSIAAAAKVTPTHLARLFDQQLGRSVNYHVHAVRIAKARELLGHNRGPISEVASMVGFTHPSSFDRTFRNLEGETPGQYRRRIAGE